MTRRLLVGFLALAPALWAQLDLYLVKETIEAPAPQILDFGSGYPGEAASIRFRLRNSSEQAAAITTLSVDGSGFSLSGAPALPAMLNSKASIDFAVIFQAVTVGTYSATLRTNGVSTLVTAAVRAGLTLEIESGGAIQPLGPIAFEAVEAGQFAERRIVLENLTAQLLTVPAITLQGSAFGLTTDTPSGTVLQPRQSARFGLRFQPAAAGTHIGVLLIGDRSYALSGASFNPALPKPTIVVNQDTAAVQFEAPARIAGSGVLSLEFQPQFPGATDPAIAFASGARTMEFTFVSGDQHTAAAAFQSGTTAGTITFTVSLGGSTAREILTIAAAPIAIVSARGVRAGSNIEIVVAGIDNTRTAGRLEYTFYDASGAALATIPSDASADFARYFHGSDAGGNFLLHSIFPVTGDVSRIAAYELSLTNSIATTRTGHILF